MTIFEIDEKMRECIDEETGEFNETAWELLHAAREEKIECAAMMFKEKVAMAEAIKAEIDNLSERLKKAEREQESLKNYLSFVLGGEKFETAKVKCAWRKSESVKIENEEIIPEKFMKVKTTVAPDKDEIKKALKAGEEIAGVVLVETNNISIK